MFSLDLSCQRPFPPWESPCTSPPREPSNTALVSGPAAWAAQILIWSCSCLFLPPRSTAARAGVISSAGVLGVLSYIQRHRVSLLDRVDSICNLCSRWEGSEFSSLAALLLGISYSFVSASACESSTGLCS